MEDAMSKLRTALVVGAVGLVAVLVAACGNSGPGTAAQERLRIELTSPTVRGAVTEAETTITGVVSVPAARVLVNDTAITVGSDGAFTQTVPLAYGSNRIVVRAESEGMTAASRTLTITRSLTLTVSSPAEGTSVAQSPVAIVGKVSDPEAKVTIVGIPVDVQSDGSFSHNLALHYPSTIIAVSASVGNTAPISQTLTVGFSNAR
jgi:hypothetical protein